MSLASRSRGRRWRGAPLLAGCAVLATACFSKPERVGGDGSTSSLCFGPDAFRVCLPDDPGLPASSVELPDGLIDTDACTTGVKIDPDNTGPDLCVIAGTTVGVAGAVSARGSLPLVLLATEGDVVIGAAATLDVSSRLGQPRGAGGNFVGCQAGTAAGDGGGGAGGSFGSKGGDAASPGGSAGVTGSATTIRGGCAGGRAGDAGRAIGGDGGGAVYLIANGSLVIMGQINASGSGGAGGSAGSPGGGGGSGGLIALHARTGIAATNGRLWANGGGGGGSGGNGGGAGSGMVSTGPGVRGAGGAGGMGGGTRGADGAIDAENGAASPGAPGAGGGTGIIKNLASQPITGGMFSPAPS